MTQGNKRIGVFTLAYTPFEGGAEIATREIIKRIPETQFVIFTHRFKNTWPRKEKNENTEIIRLGKGKKTTTYKGKLAKFRYGFKALRAAETSHKKEPFTAIWAIMASYGGISALLFKLRHPHIPLILTLQEGDSEKHIMGRVGVLYPFWKLLFKKADRIQVISHYLKEFAHRHGATCPIDIIPNGVDMRVYKPKHEHNDKTRIISTSRLVKKNGIDILISAVKELKKISNTPFHIHIVGGGPEEENLKRLAQEKGIESIVTFHGQVSAQEIPSYLACADILVRPSRSEGLGSSFLEAMAAGVPIIGTPVGGIPDFLKDRETGLIIQEENPRDCAEKINVLLTNKELREKITKNGRALIQQQYSWNIIARQMERVLTP
jgi:glycosyltransferase involved in cell wall biosynthesis